MNLMITRALIIALVLFAASQSASAQLVSPVAPAVAPTTIWNRLGIPYGFNKIRDNRINSRGNNPQWERTPRLKAIADPANLESDNPAIKRAAEVKQAEDLAPQKIKAIKFLAQMGCGCYDKDGSITDALLQAMDPVQECTPDVRLATIEAISDAIQDGDSVCGACGSTCCCNEKIALALSKSAYERNDDGCFYEPNEEIRQAAADLLKICCPGRGPVNIIEVPDGGIERIPELPETPDTPPVPDDVTQMNRDQALATLRAAQAPAQFVPVASSPVEVAQPAPVKEEFTELLPAIEEFAVEENYEGVVELAAPPSLPVTRVAASQSARLSAPQPTRIDHSVSFQQTPAPQMAASVPAAAPVAASALAAATNVRSGQVAYVDSTSGVIHLQFGHKAVMPIGTKLTVYHDYITGRAEMGQLEVVQTSEGAAIARPVGLAKVWKIAKGDEAFVTR